MANKLTAVEAYNYSMIRNVTVVFGNLFANIHIPKYKPDGSIAEDTYLVPLAYSAKNQYGYWIEQQMRLPTGNIEINVKLPRISFELVGLNPAPERGTNGNLKIYGKRIGSDGRVYSMNAPVSYAFDFQLSIWGKQHSDTLPILDRIISIFNPEISVKVQESKVLNLVNDVKVVLTSVSKDDNYQSGFDENRFMIWNLSFTVYADVLPAYDRSPIITEISVELGEKIQEYANGVTPGFLKTPYGLDVQENVLNISKDLSIYEDE